MKKSLTHLLVSAAITLCVSYNASAQQPAAPTITPPPPSADKANHPATDDKWVTVGTGTVTGIYYPAGGAVCRMINKDSKALKLRCAVESTPGSIYNIDGLRTAEFDFAIIQSDWQEHAFNGTGMFAQKGRFEKLRHMFSLHNEAITIIVQKRSNINKLDDIRGKVVNLGAEGSGVRATMEDLMKAKGWTKTDFKNVAELKSADQAKALCNGTIDVMVLATGHPNGLVQEVTSLCETKILELNDEGVQRFLGGNPELASTVIAGGMYPGVPNDVPTFGVKATFVTTSDASDDVVYKVTKTVMDNLPAFKALHPVFANLDAVKMATEGRTAPYHNGAKKYFEEKGLLKAGVEPQPQAPSTSPTPTPSPTPAVPVPVPAPAAPQATNSKLPTPVAPNASGANAQPTASVPVPPPAAVAIPALPNASIGQKAN